MQKDFQAIKAATTCIDGMLSEFSMAAMDSVLSFQEENSIEGNIVEFGFYKGRSAAILAAHITVPERLILVDLTDQIARASLATIFPSFEFVQCSSEDFKAAVPYKSLRRRCRFVHIDSSHAYRTTFKELKIAEDLLQDRGIICLDDFTNLNYSQILAAIYKYMFTTWSRLKIFLVTDEKAYLCKKDDFDFFGRFVLERIIDKMADRGVSDLCIARTDVDPEYGAIYLRRLLKGEEGRYCGYNLYERHYQRP